MRRQGHERWRAAVTVHAAEKARLAAARRNSRRVDDRFLGEARGISDLLDKPRPHLHNTHRRIKSETAS
jgi:hypothetical protein